MQGVAILSECPKCGEDRIQHGHDEEELIEQLETGAPIRAYCMACDEHWDIPTVERADIARALNK
jgi:hypothetical protein